ncbi:MAG: IS1 family transposase [Thermodesulfobacteriota bacterium]
MRKLPAVKRSQILAMLCEGSSMRSISRVVDVSINTVDRYLVLAGEACAAFHDRTVRNVAAKRVQCDEIWSFCAMKEKTAKAKGSERPDGVGDVWTWTAIDADSKLMIAWLVGGRDAGYAYEFMTDVADRLANRVQLTTDGHGAYLVAVPDAFGLKVDYAQLVKVYGADPNEDQRRYSPAQCIGAEVHRVIGDPDPAHISTSYIERSNLTLRMANRRFTRLTNAFSKKLANHCHMIALYTVWYNFVKVHKSLRMTPALAANVTDRLWSMDDLVALVDEHDAKRPRQKPGRKPKAATAESN